MPIHFILGGARSGKSRFAEQIALDSNLNVTYLATATADDNEMKARIERHKNDRVAFWQTIEEPIKINTVINNLNAKEHCLIIDCLTLWTLNLMGLNNPYLKTAEIEQFIEAITSSAATIIIVSNEVGNGIVPMGKLNREFVDESGFLHQQVAKVADKVKFIMAGLAINLK